MDYLKTYYGSIKEKYPEFGRYLYRLYLKKPFNSVKKKIKGRDNKITYSGSILQSVIFDIVGNNNKILIESDCFLEGVTFFIRGNNHTISIGAGTKFFDKNEIVFEDNDGILEIGVNNKFYGVHLAVTEPNSKIQIGNDCSFAYDIDLRTGDSHSIISLEESKRTNFAENISIGNNVWIAAHCTILKGVTLLEHTIVATRSLVTKSFNETNILIAGIPAKIKKKNITWSRQRIN